MTRATLRTAVGAVLGLLVLGCESTTNPTDVAPSHQGTDAFLLSPANAGILHTYTNSLGHEVASLIPVDASKLLPLLPAGYTIVPASALGVGAPTDGIVVLANFRGFDQTVDARNAGQEYVAVRATILVAEPAEAVEAGVSIPGAFHGYALAAHVNSAEVFASLQIADLPVELLGSIGYERGMDDASGVGDVLVTVPAKEPFSSFHHSEQGTHRRERSTQCSGTTAAWADRRSTITASTPGRDSPSARSTQTRKAHWACWSTVADGDRAPTTP